MEQKYQKHKSAFLKALGEAQMRYMNDVGAGLTSDMELLQNLGSVLGQCGGVRLFKYQPFTERNLRDCEAGVLHLSRLVDLNDVNEGRPVFDVENAELRLSSVDVEQIANADLSSLPSFLGNIPNTSSVEDFVRQFRSAQESGEFERHLVPNVVHALQAQYNARRGIELCGSLSATERSASMWDRYGDGHRGFIAGYSIDDFTPALSVTRDGVCNLGLKTLLAPTFYGERLNLTFNAAAASAAMAARGLNPLAVGPTNMEVLYLVLSLLQKAEEWEYEQEWRVVSYTCSSNAKVHYCRLRPDSMYLGLNMRDDERRRAIEIAHRNGWRLFDMQVSHESLDWALDVQEIRDS